MFQAIRYAATTGKEIKLPLSSGQAINLRQRFYSLRKALRVENHPITSLAEELEFAMEEIDSNKAYFIIRPAAAGTSGLGALHSHLEALGALNTPEEEDAWTSERPDEPEPEPDANVPSMEDIAKMFKGD